MEIVKASQKKKKDLTPSVAPFVLLLSINIRSRERVSAYVIEKGKKKGTT